MADFSQVQLPDGIVYDVKDNVSGYITGITVDNGNSTTNLVTSASNPYNASTNALATMADIGAAGGGTVTSVGITAGDYISVSGSPITTSGDITIGVKGNTSYYGTCTTAAATATKAATITGFPSTPTTGMKISVRFTNNNTVADPKLSINSGTAIAIKRYGTTAPSTSTTTSWNAGSVVPMTYDGTYWMIDGWLNNNTTYSAISQANIESLSGTTAGLITGQRFTQGFNKRLTSSAITTALTYTPIKDVQVDSTSVVDANSEVNLVTSSSHPYDASTNPLATMGDIGAAGGGTVTSVGISNATDGGLTVSNSPVTSAGTISVGHSNVLTNAQTTQAVYPITIDKNGHISAYGDAVNQLFEVTVNCDGQSITSNKTYAQITAAYAEHKFIYVNFTYDDDREAYKIVMPFVFYDGANGDVFFEALSDRGQYVLTLYHQDGSWEFDENSFGVVNDGALKLQKNNDTATSVFTANQFGNSTLKFTTTSVGSASGWNAGTMASINTSKFNGGSFSSGSFSGGSFTQGTDSFTAASLSLSGGGSAASTASTLTITFGGGNFTQGSDSFTAATHGNDSFTAASLSSGFYTAGSAPSLTVTSTTVVNDISKV